MTPSPQEDVDRLTMTSQLNRMQHEDGDCEREAPTHDRPVKTNVRMTNTMKHNITCEKYTHKRNYSSQAVNGESTRLLTVYSNLRTIPSWINNLELRSICLLGI